MKKIGVILISLAILSHTLPVLASSSYRHETTLCASVSSKQPSPWVLQRLGQDFFEQENVRTTHDYPVEVRSVFTKGKDARIYVVSRWFGFDPERIYTFSCEWLDPDGRSYTMSSASFETPTNLDPDIFYTYTAYLDLVMDLKEGRWTVNIVLNGDVIEARSFTIVSQ
jgi:hypothetical protein